MTDIQRYDCDLGCECGNLLLDSMEQDDSGDYVLFSDHQARIEALEAKLTKAVEALNFYGDTKNYEIRWVRRDCGCCSDGVRVIPENDKGTIACAVLAELRKE